MITRKDGTVILSNKEHSLLVEALRRRMSFNARNQPITVQWTGLGTLSEYKPVLDAGLMAIVSNIRPRTMGWLRLTDKGARIVSYWIGQGFTMTDEAILLPGQVIPKQVL